MGPILEDHQEIRVSYQGPRLPFKVPEIPAAVAVPLMCATGVAWTVIAVLAVLS